MSLSRASEDVIQDLPSELPPTSSAGSPAAALDSSSFVPEHADDPQCRSHRSQPRLLFANTIWLGGEHDGRPLTTFRDYARSCPATSEGLKARAAHTQCLFTFGLLEAIVEAKIPERFLLDSTESGSTFLTASHLPSILKDWRRRIQALQDLDSCRAWAMRSAESLKEAYRLLQIELFRPESSALWLMRLPNDEVASIFFAISCVAEAITSSHVMFDFHLGDTLPAFGFDWKFASDLFGALMDKMANNGWCPFLLRAINSPTALHFASTIDPSPGAHQSCVSSGCRVNNIDTSTYKTKHVHPNCRCLQVKPQIQDIMQMLGTRQIPVVRPRSYQRTSTSHACCPNNEGQLAIDGASEMGAQTPLLVASASDVPYVCISHVYMWSDGLGSTSEAGLPTCQVQRLVSLVEKVAPGGYFWIDSLCVPEEEKARKQAIGLMAKTYECADTVIVIDASICACSPLAPKEERLLRFLTSAWMHRLWTLQEAMLAKDIVFEFSGGALLDVQNLTPCPEESFDPVVMHLFVELDRLRLYMLQRDSFNVSHVSRALCWRTSSRKEDETLAVSGLLRIDASELTNVDGDTRMKVFLLRIRRIPRKIIFLISPRLALANFTWAPRTLMGNTEVDLSFRDDDASMAICTQDGLRTSYSVLYLKAQPTCIRPGLESSEWFFKDKDDGFAMKFRHPHGSGTIFSCNAVLFDSCPKNGQLTVGIAVIIQPIFRSELAVDKNRFRCKYVCRILGLLISPRKVDKQGPVYTILSKGFREMSVLMI